MCARFPIRAPVGVILGPRAARPGGGSVRGAWCGDSPRPRNKKIEKKKIDLQAFLGQYRRNGSHHQTEIAPNH